MPAVLESVETAKGHSEILVGQAGLLASSGGLPCPKLFGCETEKSNRHTRREFLGRLGIACLASSAILESGSVGSPASPGHQGPRFKTRGVVLVPEDLSLRDWPDRVARAGLNTIALHDHSPRKVMDFVHSVPGQDFVRACNKLELQIEYELHAMKELLPRELFAKEPTAFRMNENRERVADANCCVHSARALDIIGENALKIANVLRPTTGRHFFWGDDGQPWCRCPECRTYSDSELGLILENHIVRVLGKADPQAQLAHLAYANTLRPPIRVKPEPGVFLEYAPINRRYDIPYSQQGGRSDADSLSFLDANLEVFPRTTAQILEYWLDVSRASGWKRPAVKLPWNRDVFLADVETYASRGVQHITTFAVWVDSDYAKRFRDLTFIEEYGAGLRGQHKKPNQ